MDFTLHIPIEAFEKSGDENPMRIGGIVSTEALDADGERIVQEGLDFSPFLQSGWFNDNHGQKSSDVRGYPSTAKLVKKGELLPTGKRAETRGWWVDGYLLDTDEGRKIWSLANALSKSPRRLGYSIEGKVVRRDKRDSDRVTAAVVKNVAITHCPKNHETELVPLVKAMMAGAGIGTDQAGGDPGDAGPLRAQSLEGSPLHPGKKRADEKLHVAHLSDGGDGGEPDNGGFAGTDPHDEEIVKAITIAPDDGVVDEVDYIEGWADTLAREHATSSSARLTKSEARVIVSDRFPHLTSNQVDSIIHNARTSP
jgi:hypothetical protein